MHKIALFCLITFTIFGRTVSKVNLTIEKPQPTPFQDWDYLVYSQRWPITTCLDWEERKQNNRCNLPMDATIWTVHGIWPTKIGKNGPFFCDSAIHFDMSQIEKMLNDLELYWTNIEGDTQLNSFWKHEWDKHGTCASILPQLDSVTNFFQRGLSWNRKYKLTDILSQKQIVPNSSNDGAGYTVEDIFDSIRAVIGKNPNIQCVVDGRTKKSLISEIRICFDKDLDLIDCNVTKPVSLFNDVDGLLTNCKLTEPIMYYATVPGHYRGPDFFDFIDYDNDDNDIDRDGREECLENYRYEEYLLNFYNSLKFLIWFTL